MKKYLPILLKLSFIVLLISSIPYRTYSQVESFFSTIETTSFATDSVDSVADDRFNSILWADIDSIKYVKNSLILEFNEDLIWKLDTLVSVNVKVQRSTWGAFDTIPTVDTATFNLNYDTLITKPYAYRDILNFTDKHKIKAKILTITVTPASLVNKVKAILRLRLEIDLERTYRFDCTSTSAISHYYDFTATNDKLSLSWTPIAGATAYDLEWTYYDDWSEVVANLGSYSSYRALFKNNCSRITTRETFDTLSLIYPDGYLFFRVRGVLTNFAGDRLVTSWSDSTADKFHLNWHEQDLNWQYKGSFAEDGKRNEVISYFDGSLRSRQQETQVNTNHETVVSEKIYDREGRPIIDVLPVPTLDASLHYFDSLNLNTSLEPYSDNDLDIGSCTPTIGIMDSSSGASMYYSKSNPLYGTGFNSFIPEAFGYPFAITQYTPDNTQKVKIQGSVGRQLQPGSGHETKYFYGKPGQEELDRLFGNDAGDASHYTENMAIDPNGQISVSYIDAHGRTIATALAGETPDALYGIPYKPSPTTLVRNLLDNVEEKSPSLEEYYPLLVSSAGNHHFVYKLFPGSYTFNDCDENEICFDCLYDMTITITDDCGNEFNSGSPLVRENHNYSMDDYLNNTFDTTCAAPAPSLIDSFDVTLPVGSYMVHQVLTINQKAMDYYQTVFISKDTCKTLEDFINEAVDNMDFSGCNFTCDSCQARLGSEASYIADYMNDLISQGMTPIEQDTADAHEGYEALARLCSELCSGTYSICEANYTLMKSDMYPGGQYADYDLDPVTNIYSFPDSASLFNITSNAYYKNPAISWVSGSDPITVEIDGLTYTPGQLSPEDFITFFQDSWAEVLVHLHPEYCYYLFCQEMEESNLYNQRMLLTTTYQQALDSGYFDPFDTTGMNLNPDPFFTSYDTTDMHGNMIDYPYVLTPISPCSDRFNILQLAAILAQHFSYTCGVPIPDITTACEGDQNTYWLVYRAMYQYLKSLEYEKRELHYVTVECVPGFSYCGKCIGYNLPYFNAIGHTSGTCGVSHEVVCSTSRYAMYRNKTPRYFHAGSDLVSQISSITAANNYVQDSMQVQCQSQCESYAYSWMVALAECKNYSVSMAAWSSTDSLEIANRLVAVCVAGCDNCNPYGSSSVAPGTTSAVYHDISFEQVLSDVLPASTGQIDCNPSLIDFPLAYGSVPCNFDSNFIAPGNVVYPLVPPCVCENLDSLFHIFNVVYSSVNFTDFTTWIDTAFNSTINEDDLQALYDVCHNGCHQVPHEIVIPDAMACRTIEKNCATCTEIDHALNIMFQKYPGYTSADTATQETMLTNWLNNYFGFHLLFDDYITFITNCDITHDTIPCSQIGSYYYGTFLDRQPIDTPMVLFMNLHFGRYFTLYDWIHYIQACGLQGDTTFVTPNCETLKLAYDEFMSHADCAQIPNLVDSMASYFHTNYWPQISPDTIRFYLKDTCKIFELYEIDCDMLGKGIDDFSGSVNLSYVIYTLDSMLAWIHVHYYPQYSVDYLRFLIDSCNREIRFDTLYNCDSITAAYTLYINTALGTDLVTWMNAHFGFVYDYDTYVAWIRHCGMDLYQVETRLCDTIQGIPHDTTDCIDELMALAIANGHHHYEEYLDSLNQAFAVQYTAVCMNANQKFKVTTPSNEYHYTLYYYDQGDNLVRTVPPKGVHVFNNDTIELVDSARQNPGSYSSIYSPHELATKYFYNSLDKVWKQYTPDSDTSHFWYDKVGRLVVSQNAQQARNSVYSYTLFDNLSRIKEAGMIRQSTMTDAISLDTASFNLWISLGTRSQVNKTYYDMVQLLTPGLTQQNLRSRVTSVTYEDTYHSDTSGYLTASHYTYDIAGNVTAVLQENRMLRTIQRHMKRIDYDFNLHSGKVEKVYYQKDSTDQFIHRYDYDADNRLTQVYTGTDNLHWDRDAQYKYYRHGPLARTEIGRRQVQGLDYAYNLQGWLKMTNSSAMDTLHDIGADGLSMGGHSLFAIDCYGFSLGYFNGDYDPIDNSKKPELAYNTYDFDTAGHSLYNGNIRHAVYGLNQMHDTVMGYTYHYDQLNRLINMEPYLRPDLTNWNWSTGVWSNVTYEEHITYDPNGNIETYERNVDPTAPGYVANLMDDLEYHYYPNTNKLEYVTDHIPDWWSASTEDINDQSAGNYVYDKIGNLTKDTQDGANFTWYNNGKIDSIYKTSVALKFHYDPMGNRISKSVYNLLNHQVSETYYIRDAQGNSLATYTWNDHDSLWLNEQDIYGSSRLGLVNFDTLQYTAAAGKIIYPGRYTIVFEGQKQYELTNHLGNVLTTISDKKFAVDVNADTQIDYFSCAVLSQQDYYPFGMIMPGRNYNAEGYRFGFNGKENDNEVKGTGDQQDYGMRIYDPRLGRFLSVDPITKYFAMLTPYQFGSNSPILNVDVDGLEGISYIFKGQFKQFAEAFSLYRHLSSKTFGRLPETSYDDNQIPTPRTAIINFQGNDGTAIQVPDGVSISAALQNDLRGVAGVILSDNSSTMTIQGSSNGIDMGNFNIAIANARALNAFNFFLAQLGSGINPSTSQPYQDAFGNLRTPSGGPVVDFNQGNINVSRFSFLPPVVGLNVGTLATLTATPNQPWQPPSTKRQFLVR